MQQNDNNNNIIFIVEFQFISTFYFHLFCIDRNKIEHKNFEIHR